MIELIWIILGSLLLLVGIAGCILPVIPGPPIAWISLLMIQLAGRGEPPLSVNTLVTWAILVLIVTVLDYIVPVWGTKKYGGSKYGTWGSTIGLLAGLFFVPYGIIAGPFVGAVLGEMVGGRNSTQALRAGFGSFLGFLTGVILKLIVSIWIGFIFVRESIPILKELISR
jgi:uncharacterized protein